VTADATAAHVVPPQPSGTGAPRRALLGLAGITGLAAGAAALGTRPAAAAPDSAPGKPTEPVYVADSVAELTGWLSRKLADGTTVQLLGHAEPGDGGARLIRYDAASEADVNGGTVLAPADLGSTPRAPGRWLTVHDGTGDFRWFGVLGPEAPADDALDALVNDPAISRIEGHTDLNFTRRHRFTRSLLEFDFGGHTMTTEGIEKAGRDDPFAAVMFFRGTVTDTVVTSTLSATMPELRDDYEVASAGFEVGQWYALEVNALAGQWERELQRLVQVTQVIDANRIRVNHKLGWELESGRTLTWTLVEPVRDVHVRNLRFVGVAGGDQYTGSHPIAYEYAYNCDVEQVHGEATFWPLVMRRWSTQFTTRSCSLANPASVTWGGAGYLTQQIYCNYGHVVDCHTSNARHLNDWTASSYGLVENCHGDGDDQGPFVTHGQYEHDLTYVGNSGLMTFANSGAAWGGSAKRITVTRHVCSWFVARVKVTDLTLNDVQVIRKDGLAGSGMLWINADGAQLRGCRADDTLVISQASTRSSRPTVIEDSDFATLAGSPVIQATVTRPVHLVRTTLRGLQKVQFAGHGPVVLDECTLTADEGAGSVTVAGDLTVRGGTLRHVGIIAAAEDSQTVRLEAADLTGTPAGNAFLGRENGTELVSWQLTGCTSTAPDEVAHAAVTAGANRWIASHSTFEGGRLELAPAGFVTASSAVRHLGNLEDGVERVAFPDPGPRVVVADNLTL